MTKLAAIGCAAAALLLASAAASSRQVNGAELTAFGDREALVLRTSGEVKLPSGFAFDQLAGIAELRLASTGCSASPPAGLQLVRSVSFDTENPRELTVKLALVRPELASHLNLRLSKPSAHIILVEVFGTPEVKDGTMPLSESQLGEAGSPNTAPAEDTSLLHNSVSGQSTGAPAKSYTERRLDSLGIPTLDLRSADPLRVLGLAASSGLIQLRGNAIVGTAGRGEVSVRPAGQSLSGWAESTPPGELYLSGTSEEIESFMRLCGLGDLDSQPGIKEIWLDSRPTAGARPLAAGGRNSAGRKAWREYPGSLAYTNELPGGFKLSDIRVSLPATDGMNVYDVLDYLSTVSGISLMIDPYAFDLPTGSRRDPLVPDPPAGNQPQPGYRPAGIFDSQLSRQGTVIGNFVNMPLDQALALILDTHDLEYVVYGGGSSVSGGGMTTSAAGGSQHSFERPVILVTSRERLNQELSGTNQISLYQFDYADPTQIYQMLGNLDLLPGTDSGWFVYDGGSRGAGGGGGAGGGRGGSRGNGGGGSGGGNGGGVGAGGNGGFLATAKDGLLVYRGPTREPVLRRVIEAVDNGAKMVRVLLAPETGADFVTAAAL